MMLVLRLSKRLPSVAQYHFPPGPPLFHVSLHHRAVHVSRRGSNPKLCPPVPVRLVMGSIPSGLPAFYLPEARANRSVQLGTAKRRPRSPPRCGQIPHHQPAFSRIKGLLLPGKLGCPRVVTQEWVQMGFVVCCLPGNIRTGGPAIVL
ncbi:MAG: hypothetical protein CM15mP103_01250 [Gammaproteobacteria bacterium]|nr:MAG: hypothetical protein CM15mP103_01250 [Gammaproteobacteria bacterium]